ncbi:MAG TPA: T9SS type A sorting domain-containing protein, partial [Saprospiraceae bacterium]|nr:T9SS type A sorting domain-containing protein [Saprospiraceae bacterium]
STNLPNGSHTLNYKKGTSAQSTTITVSSNSFTLLSLTAGSYSDFSVTVNGCTGTFTGPVSLSDPDTPTLSAGASTNPSTCSGTNGSIQFTSTNLPNGSHTLNYKKGTSEQSTTITVSNNSFTLSSLTAGTYSDFSVTVNGCSGTFAGPVNLSDPATPSQPSDITVNPTLICGIANTINASISPVNGITYNWAVSPPVQNPMNLGGNYSFNVGDTGQYTISVSASINNCTSPVRTKAITVHPLPTASITGPSSICEKASEFFTASGGVKYHWSDETIDSVIPLAGLDDGNYTFTVTVTDTNGCTDAESKDVEVKNVPTATIKIRTTNNDSELLISPNIENIQNVEVETTRYLISKGGVTILDNTLIGTNEYKATGLDIGFTYDIRLEIKYKNGCIYVVNQFYTLNSEDCNLFNPRMNEFILNNNTLELKQCNLDSFEMNFVFSGGNLTSTNLKIGDFSIIKDLDNNSVKISIKVPLKLNTNNEFEIMVIHKYGAGGSSNQPCTYNISIDNQTVPSITLDEGNFCFRKGDLKLPITKSPSNTTFSFNGGSPSEIEIGSPKYRNETFVDSIILTNIKAEGNVCKPYNKSLTYRIYRTPEIIIDSSFCLDAIVKNILEINDKDREAIWSIYDNRGKIDTLQSGINLDSSDTLRVSGYLVHSGGPTCYTDTVTKNIIVKPLPSAKISSYTKDCGPFYKVDSLSTVTNQNARYTWKLGNDTTGILNIFNNKQIIGVTGSGILSLTQEKDGCYDHDTIAIKNSTNFTLSPDTILYRACNTDTLYYLRNFKDRDCYRWMYINPDGDIKELTDVDKPYVKLNNKNQPLLIVYGCNEPCTGTVVTNRSSGADHDCSEDMSKQDKPIEIRPNPAYDLVELYSNFKHKGKYDIYVNDITGRRIVHFVMLHDGGSFTLPFDVSGWQSGLYFVSIGSETKKLIVIK